MPTGTPTLIVTPPAKAWWSSRTLWFNAIVAALVALEMQFQMLQPLLPANVYAVLALGLAVGNQVLRVVTTTALALRAVHANDEPEPADAATAAPAVPASWGVDWGAGDETVRVDVSGGTLREMSVRMPDDGMGRGRG